MRLSIDHQTGFRYARPVKSSYNEARMTPAATDHQTVWSSRVSIEPAAWSFTYVDYWGTTVTTFELHEPHERLTVHAQGVVETHGDDLAWDLDRRVAPNDLGWPALRDRGVIDTMTEFLTVDNRTQAPEELLALAAENGQPAAAAGRPGRLRADPRAADLSARLHPGDQHRSRGLGAGPRRLPGLQPRGPGGPPLDRPAGPLRLGLPASGWRPGQHPVVGESHSWVEWWCGSWVSYDPTLQRRITDGYVRVGHGRDYGDVAPLRGTYSGGASEMFVTVQMTELG